MARVTKYEKEVEGKMAAILLWAKLGMTDVEIALSLGIAESTLNLYKKKHPKFVTTLKAGKLDADCKVTDSNYKRAIGYDYTEEDIEYIPNVDGEDTVIKKVKQRKRHIAGDVMAQMYWLNNRQPDKWRHKSRDLVLPPEKEPKEFENMPDEELIKYIRDNPIKESATRKT